MAAASAWPLSRAGGDAAVPPYAMLTFMSQRGSPPGPQVVPLHAGAELGEPVVRYGGPAGWLHAAIARTAKAPSLTVEPKPFRLGPGIYHATIDLGEAVHPGARVDVALAVVASSHSSCPPRSTLRYDGGGDGAGEPADFGKTFFGTYCISCHSSRNVGDMRAGAPLGLDWDSLSTIRERLYAIDDVAARGPRLSHDDMPPPQAPRRPSDAERVLLGRWIACGAP